ncbi:uncharacterized protein LOC116413799 [Galleria mellonella]|uniref:Uncharacterized protein LOC116413799 n=1 Tax=Galleria mellonella TaxID=7137 RepID=A0A6J3CDM6_GALME|nr:uncharacterized protein LOC116413799 [Galleria mellonella]
MAASFADIVKCLDKPLLINLVKERPCLWDYTMDSYKDKNLKLTAWREICTVLYDRFDQMTDGEQLEFSKIVTRKWSQTRDAWLKTLHETTKRPSSRPYIYHKQLLFLKKVVHVKEDDEDVSEMHKSEQRESDGESQNEEAGSEGPNESIPRKYGKSTIRNLKRIRRIEVKKHGSKHLLENKNMYQGVKYARRNDDRVRYKSNHVDDVNEHEIRHLNFFKSLLPSLAFLDDDQTLQFQSGVLNLLQNIKRTKNMVTNAASQVHHSSSYGHATPSPHIRKSSSYLTESLSRDSMQSYDSEVSEANSDPIFMPKSEIE